MKKILVIICLAFLVVVPLNASAKTISDYRNDLAKLKQEQKEAKQNQEKIAAQIEAANKRLQEITIEAQKVVSEQEGKKEEIMRLEEEIKQKESQIKELVSFSQISNSENFYLKYIFGAESFTDFIYRFSVIEQLTERSNELSKEMEVLIDDNKVKIKELEEKTIELNELNEETLVQVSKLGSQQTKYYDEFEDVGDEIKNVEEKIAYYVKQGCGENENISKCVTSVPFDFGFIRPVTHGSINDEYGYRVHPIYGTWALHKGIDIGGNKEGTPVYAVAAGRVSLISKVSCGGKIVTINHIVNGKYYTTRYWHLLSYSVSVGDIVDKGEQIGKVGGGRGTSSYEKCSTGAHLHFEMASGHYYGTDDTYSYTSYNKYVSKTFSARELIYFPANRVSW